MEKLNELLRELISAQDDVTTYSVKNVSGRHREMTGLMRKAQVRRDQIRAKIVAMFNDLKWDYDEAMRQYDMAQKRACDAETRLEALDDEPFWFQGGKT